MKQKTLNVKHDIKKRVINDDDSLEFVVHVKLERYEDYKAYKQRLSEFELSLLNQSKLAEGGTVKDSTEQKAKAKKKAKNKTLTEKSENAESSAAAEDANKVQAEA